MRPASLARYIAMSAFFSRLSKSAPSAGNIVTPSEQPAKISMPMTSNGAIRQVTTLLAISATAATSSISGTTSRNSSPPRRATVSALRSSVPRRSLTCLSSVSPELWPSVSLTFLKLSRSRYSIATLCSPRRAAACSKRSRARLRLGRPVSASCVAMISMRCCVAAICAFWAFTASSAECMSLAISHAITLVTNSTATRSTKVLIDSGGKRFTCQPFVLTTSSSAIIAVIAANRPK